MTPIGFIGTGIMGGPMAARLLRAGHRVVVFNRTRSKANALSAYGALVADSVGEVAQQCSMIFLALSDDAAVRDVVGPMRDRLSTGAIVIDCSTVNPATTREIAGLLDVHGVCYLDAPVTGSRPEAEAGELRSEEHTSELQSLAY